MNLPAMPPRYLGWLTAGFAVWGSALVALYAVHGLGCAFAWRPGQARGVLGVVLVAHLTVIAFMWRHLAGVSQRTDATPTGQFVRTLAVWLLIAAFITTIVTLAPPLLLTGCS